MTTQCPNADLILIGLALIMLAGCQSYRIEYRHRPSYLKAAANQELPNEQILPDGTKIVYVDRDDRSHLQKMAESGGEDADFFEIREDLEDGTVVVRNLLPEHVLANTLNCIRKGEYDVIWEQLLAQQTRDAYLAQDKDQEDFAEFLHKRRRDYAMTTNRMLFGIARNEVVADNVGAGMIRYRFIPQIGKSFKYRAVTIASEAGGLKLVVIE